MTPVNQQPHLTEDQLDHFLTHPAEDHPHLATCAPCRQQLASLRATFADLRQSLTSLADSLPAHPAIVPTKPTAGITARPRVWACAAAVLALGAAMVPALHHPAPRAAVVNPTTQQDDEALLEGINQDLSTPIAPSLKPLAIETQRAQ